MHSKTFAARSDALADGAWRRRAADLRHRRLRDGGTGSPEAGARACAVDPAAPGLREARALRVSGHTIRLMLLTAPIQLECGIRCECGVIGRSQLQARLRRCLAVSQGSASAAGYR
jgi:hypothetical protein